MAVVASWPPRSSESDWPAARLGRQRRRWVPRCEPGESGTVAVVGEADLAGAGATCSAATRWVVAHIPTAAQPRASWPPRSESEGCPAWPATPDRAVPALGVSRGNPGRWLVVGECILPPFCRFGRTDRATARRAPRPSQRHVAGASLGRLPGLAGNAGGGYRDVSRGNPGHMQRRYPGGRRSGAEGADRAQIGRRGCRCGISPSG